MELISIIIPLYNKEENISRTIDSVLNLKYNNWELIIIDDGSTDNSASLVKSYLYDNRIKYIHKTNGGVSSARNLGVKKSHGKWIIFLDADDYFLPDALDILYKLVLEYRTLVSCANFIVKKKDEEWNFCIGRTEKIVSNNYKAWFFHSIFPRTGAALFHHSILKEHLFDETLSRYEDAKSLFEIFRENKIAYSSKPVMVYLLDSTGLSLRASDVNKDFIFKMKFEGKSLWEKIVLCELIIQGYRLYPEYQSLLDNKYSRYRFLVFLTKVLILYRKIYNRLKSKW